MNYECLETRDIGLDLSFGVLVEETPDVNTQVEFLFGRKPDPLAIAQQQATQKQTGGKTVSAEDISAEDLPRWRQAERRKASCDRQLKDLEPLQNELEAERLKTSKELKNKGEETAAQAHQTVADIVSGKKQFYTKTSDNPHPNGGRMYSDPDNDDYTISQY